MSERLLDLGNSANWQSFYTYSGTGSAINPINPVTVPVQLENHIIAVLVSSSTAKPTWKWGGYLSKRVRLGITVGGMFDSDSTSKRKLFVGRIQLFIFPVLSPTYGLEFEFPKWFDTVSLNVWEYLGSVSDTTESAIAQVQNTVDQINAKLP